jgi:hypothetical protein
MMGEMGIDWGSAGGFRESVQLWETLAEKANGAAVIFRRWNLDAHARLAVGLWTAPAVVQLRAWPFLAHRGGDWTGYNVPEYLTLPTRARRQNERQFRRRRHAGHHGGICWATLVAAYRKMVPVRRWVAEGYTR